MVNMIDVSEKVPSRRVAEAQGTILLEPATVDLIRKKQLKKGDVQSVAELMGIQGSKVTPQIMPLCHPIAVESTKVTFKVVEGGVTVIAHVTATAKTGVEMEALTAVIVALLNVWDMVKMYEKDDHGQYPHTRITDIKVNFKEK
jgi:cyclic pyranopterin phosphate synthase